jgi:hypothetical protein
MRFKAIVVVFIIALFVSTSFAKDVQQLSSPLGTFVLGQLATDAKSDKFLLDTKTGKVWHFVFDKDHTAYLVEVPVLEKGVNLKEKGLRSEN